VKFFSGFCLQNEQELFEAFLNKSDYTVAGFSYGAQQAVEYAMHCTQRIDRLILLSPAFFNMQPKSFIRAQLHYFSADKTKYMQNFLANICLPNSKIDILKYFTDGNAAQLDELLCYKWNEEKLMSLKKRGIQIEVFLGDEDKIIDSKAAFVFFSKYATIYLIKNVGHLLDV
jgi:pimeloyl-ACP methyl ester carboxylesterase